MFDPATPGDAAPSTSQRGHIRDSLFLHAIVSRADGGGEPLTLRVRNLSSGGMMVETGERFAAGDLLRIELRNVGVVAGRIAWLRDGRIGVTFDRPVDPREVRKAPPKSAGSTMMLVKPTATSRRPGLKIG